MPIDCRAMLISLVLAATLSTSVRADLGTVRATAQTGPYELTLFTAPVPFRAGPVDVSVMVVNKETRQAITDCTISITVAPTFEGPGTIEVTPTLENAQNKLLQAALFDIPQAGQWIITATITDLADLGEPITLTATVDTYPPLPRWQSIWLWLALPIIALVIYVVHQICVTNQQRRSRSNAAGST